MIEIYYVLVFTHKRASLSNCHIIYTAVLPTLGTIIVKLRNRQFNFTTVGKGKINNECIKTVLVKLKFLKIYSSSHFK